MPTYDYECTSCGYTFEEFQSMSDKPLSKCPECGKKVRRLIGGGIGIIFKGSGFYVTDSKGGSKGAGTQTGSTDSKSGDGSEKNGSKSEASGSSEKKENTKKEKKEKKPA